MIVWEENRSVDVYVSGSVKDLDESLLETGRDEGVVLLEGSEEIKEGGEGEVNQVKILLGQLLSSFLILVSREPVVFLSQSPHQPTQEHLDRQFFFFFHTETEEKKKKEREDDDEDEGEGTCDESESESEERKESQTRICGRGQEDRRETPPCASRCGS